MTFKKTILLTTAGFIFAYGGINLAQANTDKTTLKIGLSADIDTLDPDFSSSKISRILYTSLYDKLFDIDKNLKIVPALVKKYTWKNNKTLVLEMKPNLSFHDGSPLDAKAVKYNLDRSMTIKGSHRLSELKAIKNVKVLAKNKLVINLKYPYSPLVSILCDRAGMMISPIAGKKYGVNFTQHPVGSGAYVYKSRVVQGDIILTKFKTYRDNTHYHFNKVVFTPIPDGAIRVSNLKSGQLDLVENMNPTDIKKITEDKGYTVSIKDSIATYGVGFNVGDSNHQRSIKNPFVREAFELAIDRNVINQVVFSGQYTPTSQWFPKSSPYYLKDIPTQKPNLKKAKELMKKSGYKNITLEFLIPNSPANVEIAEIIQSMENQIGIKLKIERKEFATYLTSLHAHTFDTALSGWSGRYDPDGDIYPFFSIGGSENHFNYVSKIVDGYLNDARKVSDVAKRKALYAKAYAQYYKDKPFIYIYQFKNVFGLTKSLTNFVNYPDGMIRLKDMSKE